MNNGMALVTVLIIVLLLFILVGAFLLLAVNALHVNERYYKNLMALGLAEAGADLALWEINFGGNDFDGWSGTNPKTMTLTNFQDTDGNVYGDIDISVYDPGADEMTIMSEGAAAGIAVGPGISRSVRVVVGKQSLFNYAVLSAQTITMNGNAETDSYDSLQGAYGGANQNDEGDIVTNGTGNPAISLTGNAEVNGDGNTGPGGTISTTGNSDITGAESDTADEPMPSVDVPDGLEGLTSLGPLSLSGNNSLTLPSDDYKYDSISLSGNSILTLSGLINLYVTGGISTSGNSQIIMEGGSAANLYFEGDLSISGNGVWNKTGDPSEFALFGTDTSSQVSFSGNADFYGTVYAPSADVTISGNGEYFGAVAGDDVSLSGNAKVHYDEQLKNDGPKMGYGPEAWQEKY